jgi:phage gp36-like protein
MNKYFGTNNVNDWANIDNDSNATTISNRITQAIADASEEVDDFLRSLGYRIPIQTAAGTTPPTILRLTMELAGLWLYEARGAEDYNRQGGPRHGHAWRRDWVYGYMDDLKSGRRVLDAQLGN